MADDGVGVHQATRPRAPRRRTAAPRASRKPSTSASVRVRADASRGSRRGPRPASSPARPARALGSIGPRSRPTRPRPRSPPGRARARAGRRAAPSSAAGWPGSRSAPRGPRRPPASPASRRSRSCRRPSPARARRRQRGGEPDDAGDVLGARAQAGLLAAAPDQRRAAGAGSRATSAPTPFGPVQLVGRERHASRRPAAAKEIGIDAAAWTASTCSGTPRYAAIAASSATGCTTPVTLFAHIAQATRSSARTSSANAARIDHAVRVDRSPSDLEALARELLRRRADGGVLDHAAHQPAQRPAAEPEHRLVVGLRAARRVDDLLRPAAEQLGHRPARALDRGAGLAAHPRAARTGCRTGRTGTAPSPPAPRRTAATSPRDRGTRCSWQGA